MTTHSDALRADEHQVSDRLSGIDAIAAGPRAFVNDLRALYSVLTQTLHYTFRGKPEKGAITKQMYAIGNESVLFITMTMLVIGMILVLQTGLQTKKVIPELSLLGANLIQMVMREFAPTVCGLMIATRVGAGIAAEIGSMVVTEQVDALRMCAADPIEYLVVPRFVGGIVMGLVLTMWALGVTLVAGTITANLQFDLNYGTFLNFSLIKIGDFVVMIAKAVSYGAAIPIVSSHRGLSTFGGSEGVGWATTSAVVHSSLAIIVLDFILGVAGYVVFPP
jgi:phospholipid/cholesterol/gamma-HCH transport system permease protein